MGKKCEYKSCDLRVENMKVRTLNESLDKHISNLNSKICGQNGLITFLVISNVVSFIVAVIHIYN